VRSDELSPCFKEGAERNSDRIKIENFYYTALYDVLQEPGQHAAKAIKLKNLKAKNYSFKQLLLPEINVRHD